MEQEVDALLRMEAIECDWILQSIIHRSKEGWGVGSDHRSVAAERRYQTISVQDAHYQTDCVSNQVRGLVCHDRSQGSYFHISILPQHRKFLRFAFGGEAYQYRVLPFTLSFSLVLFLADCFNFSFSLVFV